MSKRTTYMLTAEDDNGSTAFEKLFVYDPDVGSVYAKALDAAVEHMKRHGWTQGKVNSAELWLLTQADFVAEPVQSFNINVRGRDVKY